MFCTVYPLRRLGALLKPTSPTYMMGLPGMLIYERDHVNRMFATLVDVETGAERMCLHRAHVVKARDGGVLIAGDEVHYRASKDKGTAYRQTWWCVPLTQVIVSQPAQPGVASDA